MPDTVSLTLLIQHVYQHGMGVHDKVIFEALRVPDANRLHLFSDPKDVLTRAFSAGAVHQTGNLHAVLMCACDANGQPDTQYWWQVGDCARPGRTLCRLDQSDLVSNGVITTADMAVPVLSGRLQMLIDAGDMCHLIEVWDCEEVLDYLEPFAESSPFGPFIVSMKRLADENGPDDGLGLPRYLQRDHATMVTFADGSAILLCADGRGFISRTGEQLRWNRVPTCPVQAADTFVTGEAGGPLGHA